MRFLAVLPYYGTHHEIEKLYTSLGVRFPGYDAIAQPETITPFAHGDIYLRNNNFENIGYTRASNMGIRYAMDHGYDAIWLLTDDIEIVDVASAVASFEKELTENPKTGIIGCKICFKENPDFIYHGGTERSFPSGIHKSGSVSAGDYSLRTLECWVPGGSLVVSRKCAQDIGVMDENFFNIGSDSDYGFRARLAGYNVVYLPVTVLHPSVSMTSAPTPEQRERLQRDVQYFSEKWVSGNLFKTLEYGAPSFELRQNDMTVVISYCSLDQHFLVPMLREITKFATDIVVVAASHLLNGTPENFDALREAKNLFPHIRISVLPWSGDKPPRYWHNAARWEGLAHSSKPWVLFLDGDEIPDGDAMVRFLKKYDFSADGYAFRCYWYFREPEFQATTLSQCGLLIKRALVDYNLIFSESERAEFRNRPSLRVEEGVVFENVPLFHHYSWVRTKETLLMKVDSWAHRGDRDWKTIIEEEFSHPFRGREEVHGFEYVRVPNRFNITL